MLPSALQELFKAPDIRELNLISLHIVMGTRLAVIWGQAGRDPLPALAARLESVAAARSIMRLVRLMDANWPDPFTVARPCMTAMTPDEAMLAQCATALQMRDLDGVKRIVDGYLPSCTGMRYLDTLVATVGLLGQALDQRLKAQQPD